MILSHLDGIGMAAALDEDGGWGPLFPHAEVVLNNAELQRVAVHPAIDGAAALGALVDCGVVRGVGDRWETAPGVTIELTGGHTPGHVIFRIGDGAVFLGHLAISPLSVTAGLQLGAHDDAPVALSVLERELSAAASGDSLLIGPLWPAPGAGRVLGPPWTITPA